MSFRSFISAAAFSAVGVATLSLFAVSVQGAESAAPQITVSLSGFDLSKQNDASAVYARLRRAAAAVCEPLESKDLRIRQLHRQCYSEALGNAIATVDNAKLTALYSSDDNIRIASRGARSRG